MEDNVVTLEELINALADLRERLPEGIYLNLAADELLFVVGALQLAMRHPLPHPTVNDGLRCVIDRIDSEVDHPTFSRLIRQGFDQSYDSLAAYPTKSDRLQ